MMTQHFPALLVILPLMAAPVCVILRRSMSAWVIALVVNLCLIAIAFSLLNQTLGGQVIHYALGGWVAPTGIEYYIDTVNACLVTVVVLVSFFTLFFSQKSIALEIAQPRHYLFYTGWLLCLTGLLGILITGDAFNVFVFLEISSLSMYMLIALGYERKHALLAAFRYLVMGSIGASFILLGIGFLYAATGTLNMADLATKLPAVSESRTVLVGFTLITLGIFIKTAVFPVYSWLPGAYQYGPSAVSAFLAGTATKVSLYIFLRFFFHVFGSEYSFGHMLLANILLPLAVIGFFVMSVVAIYQTDLRRLLAYSSIAQIGYIFAVISMATLEGISAGIIHIINHAFIKAALFMAVGCIVYRLGHARIKEMTFLIQSMPWTVGAFILGGISLIGIPLTAGFISKWHLVLAAIHSGWWIIAVMVLISSLMAILYIGKVIEVMCFKRDIVQSVDVPEAPKEMLIPLWLLLALSIYTGIDASFVVDTAQMAAGQLLEAMR